MAKYRVIGVPLNVSDAMMGYAVGDELDGEHLSSDEAAALVGAGALEPIPEPKKESRKETVADAATKSTEETSGE